MQNSGAPAKVRSLALDDGRAFIESLLERKTRSANHCLCPEVPGSLAPQSIHGYVRAFRAAWRQDLGQRMEKGIRHILGAWAELQRRQEFGHRVKRHPHPQVRGCVAQSGVQFIQLHMPEGQVPEEMSLNLVGVLTGAREPRHELSHANCGTTERQACEAQPWFRAALRFRAGIEGRISGLKRARGLDRCRNKGEPGMELWLGWGVIANNLAVMAHKLARRRRARMANT